MKFKTFILTFLMMMSCSISFGQGSLTGSATTEAQLWMHLNDDEIGTISLANDIKITATCPIPNGKKVTIDLNGHKLFTEEEIYIINNEGKLTITDNSEGKTGTISSTLGIYNGVTPTRTSVTDVKYDRVLTINGGVFNSSSENGNAATIYNYRGVIKINGGEFYGEHSAITNYGMATIANAYIECLNRDNGAAAIINDYEITYGENVNIVGIYTTVTETAYTTGTEPTYLFAELKNGPKYPSLQAALDACTTGDNTINLLFHNSDNATVSQKEGVNITIDGNGYKDKQFEYTGTIYVNGNSRYTGTETLTIQDVNFVTTDNEHDFISCNDGGNSVIRYAHNVTVQNCNFTATEGSTAVVALRFRQSYNINVVNSKFTNLHSAMWATGTSGIAFDNIEATKCKEGGISAGTSTPVSIKNSTIEGAKYGVRADGSGAYSLTVENSELTAEVPVIVRNTTGEYNLTVKEDATLASTNNGPQVVVTKGSDNADYVVPTSDVNVTLYDNVTSTFGLTAKIGNAFYATLQDAVDNAKTGETVTLIADNCKEDVTVNQAPNYAITIDGDDNTFKGTITVDGKSARYETTALTIKNVNFDATEGITYDACINLGVSGNTNTRYTNKVTVENCTFTDNDYSSVAVKSYTGGDRNLVVKDCEANGMHSLLQLTNVEEGLIVDNCTANTKNGLNLGSSAGVVIKDSEISVQGYAVRIGASSGGASGAITLENNTLETNNSEGDAVIVVRGAAVTQVDLSMTENVVSGTTHISGNTADTKIAADANYWDGKEAPVATTPVDVFSYYAELNADGTIKEESLKSNVVAKIGEAQYTSLQAAINAVKNGEKITLVVDCAEAVHINKTNVAFTIDGQISETEKVDFSGVIGINIGQNVTISNVDFNGATANHDFIKNEGSPTGKNYNTTLLVENCSFTGNPEFDVVGIRTIHPTHTQIVNCKADGLHSLLQNTGGQKVTVDDVVVINGKEGGLALGGVRAADVKNSEITANGYGIRIDAATKDAEFNIESSEFNAYIPVIARKATAQNVNFTFSGENVMNQTNNDEVWFVIDGNNSKYHEGNVSLEDIPAVTGKVLVTLEDEDSHAGIHGLVAKIGKVCYSSLQDAVDNANDNDVVTLIADVTEDEVLITQKADVDVTIDGNNKTFTGRMTIFGSGRYTGAETLTIKNVVFQAKDGKGECIASATKINDVNSYAHNVTIEGCTFNGNDTYSADNTFAIRFPSGGVGYDLTVTGCTADDKMFGLLWVTQVGGELIVDNCTAEGVKEGIVLTSTTKATITNTTIDASNVAIRAGQTGAADGTINEFTFNNNTLKSGAIAIQLRGNATDANLSMTKNVVSGTIHISGHTAATQLAIDANYWDGEANPISEPQILVNSYYLDEELQNLVLNHHGNDFIGYTGEDAIWGEVWGNAFESFVIKAIDANGNVMGTASLKEESGYIDGDVEVTWSLYFDVEEYTGSSWEMNWTTRPTVANMPVRVELHVDGVKVGEGPVQLNDPDDLNKMTVAKITNDENGYIEKFYTSFDAAYKAATTGDVFELLETAVITNTSNSRVIRYSSKNITVKANFGGTAFRVQSGNEGYNYPVVYFGGMTIESNDYCIIVGAEDSSIGADVEIQGGTYNGVTSAISVTKGNLLIVGGTFQVEPYEGSYEYTINCIDAAYNNNDADVSIKGGKFYNFNPQNNAAEGPGTNFLTAKYAAYEDADNYWNVVPAEAMIVDNGKTQYYATLQDAVSAATDGQTVTLCKNINESVNISKLEKNITIDGNDYGTTHQMKGLSIGSDDNNLDAGVVTIKNIAFNGKGLSVKELANVTIQNNTFTNITEGNAITVICDNLTEKVNVSANTITNVEAGTGIRIRNAKEAAVTGNKVSEIFNNAILLEGNTTGDIAVTDNVLSNWGKDVEEKGRAIRIVKGENTNATITGNAMLHDNAPEQFVKISGNTENVNVNENYWNGQNPFAEELFTDDGNNNAYPNSYYAKYDAETNELSELVTIAYVAKIGKVQYLTFEAALNAVQDDETIELFNITGSENKELEFTKDIEFTITGEAPNYALPIVTFQNAKVNIKDAEILIPELDARQNATINVINSTVYDAGGDGIVKSYYNGAINIDANSTVYTMQVTTMGYITVDGTLNATWQTNVYGNGLITLNEGATFATAGLNLIAKEYSGRDNTDEERVGKPAEIVVDGANFTVGKVYSASGADYSYNSSKGINVGTVDGKSAILNIMNGGNVNIYMANGETANIGAGGTVKVDASTLNTICRSAEGEVTLANNGTMNVTGAASINIKKLTGNALNFTDVTIADAYIGGAVNAFGTNNFTGETNVTGIFSVGYYYASAAPVVVNVTGNFNGGNVLIGSSNEHVLNLGNAEGNRTTAHFGQLGAFADVNIVNSDVTYGYAFVRNGFNVTNSTMEIKGGVNTYFAGNAKVVLDNTTWDLRGYANIGSYGYPDSKGNADVTLKNGSSMTAINLGVEQYDGKTVILTLEDSSTLTATNLSNTGSIVLAGVDAKITSNEFDNAPTTTLAYHKVNYVDGSYVVVAKDYVAQIYDVNNNTNDDRRYETLQAALNAVQDGETIKLIADEIFTEDNRTNSSGTWYEGVYYEGDKNFTIDLNNYKVTQNGAVNDYMFLFKNAGAKDNTITLKNGTIDAGTDAYCAICTSTTSTKQITINTENINFVGNNSGGAVLKIRGGAELNVKAGTKITGKNSYVGIEAAGSKTVVNIYEGAEIYQNGESSYWGCLAGASGNSTINVYGGKGTSAKGGFIAMTSGGTINVSGGEWTANTNGATANDNNAVLIAQSADGASSIVNVTGGIFKGGYNCYGNAVGDAQINISGGIFSVDPSDYCAENYGAFPYDETSWVVREIKGEQTIALQAGWNWMSSYISEFDTDGLTMLTTKLGENGVQIKNNLGSLTNGGDYYGWYGTLNAVSVKDMYKVNVVAAQEIDYQGSYVNYDECVIPLYKGWNYIGYPVNERMSLADALAELDANVGDVIKAQNGTAVYTEEEGWFSFDLTELVPGEGYMYQNTSNSTKQLTYTTKKTTSTDSDNRSSKYWTVDATQYPSNMTMIAMTDVEGGDYEVAAFVNGELRGSSRPVYVESLNAHILVLTISGDEVAEVTFKYYDIATGEEVAFSNRINYSNDAVVGSMAEPYMLTRGTTGIGEASLSEISIYPNPTTTGTEINLQATCDKVEVFNALGVKVAEYQNVDTIDALETAGIYVIRITNNGNVQNCRLVVK